MSGADWALCLSSFALGIAIGIAAVTILTMTAFYRMGALAVGYNDHPEAASRPFDLKRSGFVMSEGAGILVLEELDHALARNATIYAEIVGFGMTGDAHHITDPDREGAKRCIQQAMKDGGVTCADIDYVNPHATATPVGDRNETLALKEIFGDNASRLLVSGTKSMTGHLLGAAGAVEAIFSILAINHGVAPPTINLDNPDPECDLDYVPNTAREMPVNRSLVSASPAFAASSIALRTALPNFASAAASGCSLTVIGFGRKPRRGNERACGKSRSIPRRHRWLARSSPIARRL